MGSNSSGSTSLDKQAKSGVTRAVMSLVVLGVVLGAWRWLGKGTPIWEFDQWFTNASSTLSGFMDKSPELVQNIFNHEKE